MHIGEQQDRDVGSDGRFSGTMAKIKKDGRYGFSMQDSIEHADPPTMIDEQEAAAISDVQHAYW